MDNMVPATSTMIEAMLPMRILVVIDTVSLSVLVPELVSALIDLLLDRGILKIIIIQKVVGMITMQTTMQTHIIMEIQVAGNVIHQHMTPDIEIPEVMTRDTGMTLNRIHTKRERHIHMITDKTDMKITGDMILALLEALMMKLSLTETLMVMNLTDEVFTVNILPIASVVPTVFIAIRAASVLALSKASFIEATMI